MCMVGSISFLMKNSSKLLDTQLTPLFPILTVYLTPWLFPMFSKGRADYVLSQKTGGMKEMEIGEANVYNEHYKDH